MQGSEGRQIRAPLAPGRRLPENRLRDRFQLPTLVDRETTERVMRSSSSSIPSALARIC